MFMYDNEAGGKTVLLDTGESVTVELPGGNGETFTVNADDRSVTDEDGFDLTRARLYWDGRT